MISKDMVKTDDDEEEEELNNLKSVTSHYDESVEVVGADDVLSPPSTASVVDLKRVTESNKKSNARFVKKEKMKNPPWQASEGSENSDDVEEDDEDDEDDDDDDDDVRIPVIQGAYDPTDYEELAVTEEIKEVFNYITKYIPQNIDLENKLCPFLPEFIPAVGDIDAFVKVPRPDGKKDGLGLVVLDEPSTQQSDAAVLQLQLRAVARQSSAKALVVKKIENAEKNGKSIERWIKAISDLHSAKPSPTVQYTKPMPNMDNLLQEWPQELDDKLNTTAMPNPELDCDLSTYVTIVCNLFDIPVYESKIQSLHAFFSLYSNVKSTQKQSMEQTST